MECSSSGPSIEQRLKDVYVPTLIQAGMSVSEANELFSAWLTVAKEESKNEDMDNLPENFGDLLLQMEATGPNIKAWLAKVRREGGTDEDIRNWWNLHDLERRIMLKNDENSRMAVVMDQLEKMGATKETMQQSMEKAIAHARKYFPFWGDPDDCAHLSRNDRPLPEELKVRVNLWIQRKRSVPKYKEEVERSTTFNALIRREISEGNL
jgi:hypothetical protein